MGRRTLLLIASILVAATGTALVWLYVQGAESRARAGQAMVPVYVALADISAGAGRSQLRDDTQAHTDDTVVRKLIPASAVPVEPVTSLDRIGTRTARQMIFEGQILIESQFGDPATSAGVTQGKQAISLDMPDPNRVAGLLRPESRVALYYIPGDVTDAKTAAAGKVSVLLDDVRVISVGNATTALTTKGTPARVGTQAGVSSAIVSLDVTGKEAAKIIAAITTGTIYFTLLGKDAKGNPDDGVIVSQLLVR